MKLQMTKIAAGLALAAAAAGAQAANVVDMSITGGTFFMAGVSPAPTAFGPVAGVDVVDGYANWGPLFNFFGGPVSYYTAATNAGSANTAAGSLTGGPVPSATVDVLAGTISVDLSSLFAVWNGTTFNQGAVATGTWNSATGEYNISWDRLIVGGSFDGFTGAYTMQGVAAVPEASTYGMMLAGLGLVGFAVRRRKLLA